MQNRIKLIIQHNIYVLNQNKHMEFPFNIGSYKCTILQKCYT